MIKERELNQVERIIIQQNIIKNATILLSCLIFSMWVYPYVKAVEAGVDAFLFLSIFPLGAMFAYFSFSYSNTKFHLIVHKTLADVTTYIFVFLICCSVAFATIIGVVAMPELAVPFTVISVFLILGCVCYDFWDLLSCTIEERAPVETIRREPGLDVEKLRRKCVMKSGD